MVKAIKYNIVKSKYLFFSIIALIVFIVVVVFVWRDIEKESLQRTKGMAKDVAISNVIVVENIIADYAKQLQRVKKMKSYDNDQLFNQTIETIKKQDSTIKAISIVCYEEDCSSTPLIETIKGNLLRFYLPLENVNNKILIMDVSLIGLHDRIANSNDLRHAYVTVIADNRYIYHPDETRLGEQTEFDGTFSEIEKGYSEFLNLDVYKYSEIHTLLRERDKWIYTANVIDLDFQDFIERRGEYFLWILFSALFAFLLIVAFGLLRWRKEFEKRRNAEQQNFHLAMKNEQQKQAAVSTELEILKSGLNPHFLFNALSSLKILVTKQPELAKDFAVNLSNVYRYLLKYEKKDIVGLSEELKFVKDYVHLQKIRFGDKIKLELVIDSSVLQKKVPPLSLQMLVENAIKHTVITKDKPLSIIITSKGNKISVVNDYHPRISISNNTGKGIENLKRRYSLITSEKCHFIIEGGKYIAQIPLLG